MTNVLHVAQSYSQEVTQVVVVKKFADGFAFQKGAIFGFAGKESDDTGTVLKISNLSAEKLMQLNEVWIHNLVEECSVGFLDYELDIRGKQNLEAASRKMVLYKSFDLINQCTKSSFKN